MMTLLSNNRLMLMFPTLFFLFSLRYFFFVKFECKCFCREFLDTIFISSVHTEEEHNKVFIAETENEKRRGRAFKKLYKHIYTRLSRRKPLNFLIFSLLRQSR